MISKATHLFLAAVGMFAVLQTADAVPSYSRYSSIDTETFTPAPATAQYLGKYCADATNGDGYVTFPLLREASTGGDTMGVLPQGDAEVWTVTKATAWLYENFAKGTLDHFIFHSRDCERELKEAIWYFESQLDKDQVRNNRFVDQVLNHFGSLEQATEAYNGTAVCVIELVEDSRFDKGAAPVFGKGAAEDAPPQRGLMLTDERAVEEALYTMNEAYGEMGESAAESASSSGGFAAASGASGFGGFALTGSTSSPGPTNINTATKGGDVPAPGRILIPAPAPTPGSSEVTLSPGGEFKPNTRGGGLTGGKTPPPSGTPSTNNPVPDTGTNILLFALALIAVFSVKSRLLGH